MAVYFMNNNQRVIKVVGYEALREVTQTQELPDDGSLLKDMLTVSAMNDERLDDAQYMAVESYTGNKQSFDMYRIVNQRTEQNWTTFDGVQLAYYELDGSVIEDIRPKNAYIDELVPRLLKGTDWTLGYVDDNLPKVNAHIYYLSVKDALAKVQSVAGVEMIFKVEISGNQVTDKWVEIYERLGDKTLKRFNYGTNALTVVRETSHQDLYTALIGRGKGEEVSSAEDNESGQAGYGRKITFRDVEWSKAEGKPLDKPKGQLFLEQPEATSAYGIQALNGEKLPCVGIVEFSDTEDPNVLIQQVYEALEYYARPKVLFKASVVNIGATGIGDTVTIHRHDLNIHYQTRVRKVIRDKINDNRTQVELGDVVHTSSTKKQANINSALNNLEGTIRDTARNEILPSLPSANGVNQNFYQNEEPGRKRTGDLWYRDHPSLAGHRQLLMWNGEAWELLADTSDKEQVNRRIDEQEDLLEKYSKDLTTTTELANNVSEKASQLEQNYQDVKASTDSAMNKAVDAYMDAQSALASIDDLEIGGRNLLLGTEEPLTVVGDGQSNNYLRKYKPSDGLEIEKPLTMSLEYEITGINENELPSNFRILVEGHPGWHKFITTKGNGLIGRVKETSTIASSRSGITTIQFRADYLPPQATIKFSKVKLEKGTVATDWTPAPEDVDANIANAWRVANEALSDVENLDQSVQQEFTNINGQLSSKAEQTTVNEINRTVQNQGSELLQAQNMIALKADRTDVDTLNEIIETNSAELSVLAGEISSKVDQQTVDNLNQTVENLSAEQIIQSEKISERLTRTEVAAEIERRVNDMAGGEFSLEGFAEVEYVENLIENTADSFSQSIESVRKLVPTSYENRNLLIGVDYSSLIMRSNNHNVYPIEDEEHEGHRRLRRTFPEGITNGGLSNFTTCFFDTEIGEQYTASLKVKPEADLELRLGNGGTVQTCPANEWTTLTHTFKSSSTESRFWGVSSRAELFSPDFTPWIEYKELKAERGTKATPYSVAPEDLQNEVTILRSDYERTAEEVTDRLTKIDGNNGYISEIRRDVGNLSSSITEYEEGTAQRFNLIESDIRSTLMNIADLSKDTESRFTQTEEEMSLLVRSSDLISEINLQADRQIFRVGDNRLMITEDTTYLDNAVIKSAHIADLAVTGAKIADASISSAKIINLDVDKISGNTTNFIMSNWNSVAGGNVRITGSGIVTTASDQSQTYIQNGIVGTRNPSGATIGQIGYINDDGSPSYTISTSWGSHFKVRQNRSGSLRDSFALLSGGYDGYINTNRFEFRGNQGVHFYNQLTLQNDLNGNKYNIYGVYDVQLDNGGYLRTIAGGNTRLSSSGGMLQLGVSGSWKLNMDSTRLYAHVPLSMEGNSITNQSDERLKRNIMPSLKDSLGKFSKLEFKWFEYLENLGLADGLHHGVMAQDVLKFAPEWVMEDEQGYYSLNHSAMLMDAFKAIMQLSKKVKKLEAK